MPSAFIAVSLCGVDVAIANPDGSLYCRSCCAVIYKPCAQRQLRDFYTVCQSKLFIELNYTSLYFLCACGPDVLFIFFSRLVLCHNTCKCMGHIGLFEICCLLGGEL